LWKAAVVDALLLPLLDNGLAVYKWFGLYYLASVVAGASKC
jgi:hypothetical protein